MSTSIMAARMPVPSVSLLRAVLRPKTMQCTPCQTRSMSKFPNFMPRHKYAKVNRLDKLHRQQKKDLIQEKLDSYNRALMLEETLKADAEQASISELAFHVGRTKSKNFPVYETTKAGGSKKITTLKYVTGDIHAAQDQLLTILNLPRSVIDGQGRKKEPVAINGLTKHIIIAGWRGAEVKKWAEVLGF